MCVWVIYCSVSVSRRVKLLQLFATYKTTVIDSHTQTDVETQYICIRQQQQGYVCRAIALLQYKQRVCSIALTASRMRRRASCCQQTYPAGLPTHQCQCIQQCATPPSPPYVPPGLLAMVLCHQLSSFSIISCVYIRPVASLIMLSSCYQPSLPASCSVSRHFGN